MTFTRWRVLVALGAAGVALGWWAQRLWESSGRGMFPLPWSAVAAMVVIAVVVVVVGIPVRRWNRGQATARLDPLRAARTVVLARASSRTGALLAGWYLGQLVVVLPDVSIEPRRDHLVAAAAAVLAAAVMLATGLVVERWCRLPPADEAG